MDSVLIVDDEAGIRETLLDVLEAHGFRIEMAENGQQAVDKVMANDYGLVLLDITLPVIGGVEALWLVKKVRPEMPIVMMASESSPSVAREVLWHGAESILYKPLDMGELLSCIEKRLGSSRNATTG